MSAQNLPSRLSRYSREAGTALSLPRFLIYFRVRLNILYFLRKLAKILFGLTVPRKGGCIRFRFRSVLQSGNFVRTMTAVIDLNEIFFLFIYFAIPF